MVVQFCRMYVKSHVSDVEGQPGGDQELWDLRVSQYQQTKLPTDLHSASFVVIITHVKFP
jgi:hypothetical protein